MEIGIAIAMFKIVCKGEIRRLNHAAARGGKDAPAGPV